VSDTVTLDRQGDIALITIDDGKANALSPEVIAALNEALDRSEDAGAVVLGGRAGVFSGGFDLKVMRSGDFQALGALVTSGGELVLRLFSSPQPIVCACTGHAIAAGALLALGSHFRVGAEGDHRIGLTETAIGLVLPDWAVVMADERLDRTEVQRSAVEARVYSPAEARDAGFLDVVVPPDQVMNVAMEEANRLAALDRTAYSGNLAKLRGPCIERLAAAVAKDRAQLA
jgi:enoyl-CoA hydratase